MADRFPLILNTSANQIQEIASGDQLDLSGNNIANAGVITATTFSGSIAGASNGILGIITAAAADIDDFVEVGSNIQLGNAGVVTATTFKGNGDFVELDVDGHTNLDNVNIAGIATVGSNLVFGSSGDSDINHKSSSNALRLRHNTQTKLAINATSSTFANNIVGNTNLSVTGDTTLTGDLDVDGHTNLDNVSIAGVSTFAGNINGKDITLTDVTPSITFYDSNANSDFRIIADNGVLSFADITNNANRINLQSNGTVNIQKDLDVDGHTNLDNVSVSGVSTFAGNADFSAGIDVTGNVIASGNVTAVDGTFSGNVSIGGTLTYEDVTNIDSVGIVTARLGVFIPDNNTLKFGNTSASPDLKIEHVSSGTFNRLHASNGYMQYRASAHYFNDEGSSINFIRCENNRVDLRYNGSAKLTTETSGVNITGICTATSYRGDGSQLTGIVADKIFEGDTEVECTDSGGDGAVTIKADNTNIFQAIKLGTNYGVIGINQFTNRYSAVSIAHTGTSNPDPNISLTSPSVTVGGGTGIFMKSSNDIANHKRYGTWIQSLRSTNDNGSPDFIIMKENAGATGLAEHLRIDAVGQVLPGADNSQNLGSSTKRWANIYSADIHCSNKGSSNNVDGTWGDFTIQEGESDLFLINNRSGKKYKFNLTEVN